ncbi:AAA family ATPase [Microbacterium sp. NPDC057407]|uniref:AAA family ATPase n=1 Tax=Microbacterium sp. NPDC057407 TaxID=3346120 RepID=UPI003670109D
MRGGLRRWKRGVDSRGVSNAVAYATEASCDAHFGTLQGVEAALGYGGGAAVTRFVATSDGIRTDALSVGALRRWIAGEDPASGEPRGRKMHSPNADLMLDGTINFPKSYSIAAIINPEIAAEFEALQDRLRDRIITIWQRELNARRGAGGCIREDIARLEVVELQHRRSRALDPHVHRHLWLNIKVQGADGKWSNVDSRVAMKLHTVINAEGELASRTDPRWIAALAAHGYTLNSAGEISQLMEAVRPFSRRSNQIEANRLSLIAAWKESHPDAEPGAEELHHIDERAWAIGRPNKPDRLDENSWTERVREELVAIDSTLLCRRSPTSAPAVPAGSVDRARLASVALVDADDRSVSSSGRLSLWDLRAGATRALAQSGIVADRAVVEELIDDITERALAQTIDLIPDDEEKPAHIKALMAERTVMLKLRVAALFAHLSTPGRVPTRDTIGRLASALQPETGLTDGQLEAVTALVGTDRLVTVIGPAGAGKTTILKIASQGLAAQQRRMIVVAPTKKAATVAEREIGATASSLHALLHDHGYRWRHDETGVQVWSQLASGDVDDGGSIYSGPRQFPLQDGDRVIVDEAGMVDLQSASALAELALQTGAGIAMVGDPHQAAPVGHAGAMALMHQHANRVVELTDVHRFDDPTYADLTLRLRNAATYEEALAVAADLDAGGHVVRVESADEARGTMVDAWLAAQHARMRTALVVGSNDEADAVNEAIQQRRVEADQLLPNRVAFGQNGQRLLEGDVVQTRRNHTHAGVQNRATWVIGRIRPDRIELRNVNDSTDRRRISLDYVADHVHLAYATTVHGIQGETTDECLVGPDVDAAGLYVGLTRGRQHNHAIVIAASADTAREAIADTLARGVPESTVEDSRAAARTDLQRAARTASPAPESATPSEFVGGIGVPRAPGLGL